MLLEWIGGQQGYFSPSPVYRNNVPRCVLIHRIDLNFKFITLIIKSKWLGESFSTVIHFLMFFSLHQDEIFTMLNLSQPAMNTFFTLLQLMLTNLAITKRISHSSWRYTLYYKTYLSQLLKVKLAIITHISISSWR